MVPFPVYASLSILKFLVLELGFTTAVTFKIIFNSKIQDLFDREQDSQKLHQIHNPLKQNLQNKQGLFCFI